MLKVLMEKLDTMKTQMGNINWEMETIRKNQNRGEETGFRLERGKKLFCCRCRFLFVGMFLNAGVIPLLISVLYFLTPHRKTNVCWPGRHRVGKGSGRRPSCIYFLVLPLGPLISLISPGHWIGCGRANKCNEWKRMSSSMVCSWGFVYTDQWLFRFNDITWPIKINTHKGVSLNLDMVGYYVTI